MCCVRGKTVFHGGGCYGVGSGRYVGRVRAPTHAVAPTHAGRTAKHSRRTALPQCEAAGSHCERALRPPLHAVRFEVLPHCVTPSSHCEVRRFAVRDRALRSATFSASQCDLFRLAVRPFPPRSAAFSASHCEHFGLALRGDARSQSLALHSDCVMAPRGTAEPLCNDLCARSKEPPQHTSSMDSSSCR